MRLYRLALAAPLSLAFGLVCGGTQAAEAVSQYIVDGVTFYGRPNPEVLFDPARKPADVMAFAGARPGMAAADLMPEGGYWTRIMSAIAGEHGNVYMMVPRGGTPDGRGPKLKDVSQNLPLDRVDMANGVDDQPEFPNLTVIVEPMAGGDNGMFSTPRQLDLVFTANDFHVFHGAEFAKQDIKKMIAAIFRATKNGGSFVVLDNRASSGSGFSSAALNRVDPDAVKAEILSAGFALDGESNILAKPNDDRGKAVGDNAAADVFLLKFKKPANAPNTDKRPPDIQEALAGYYGNTAIFNPGVAGNVSGSRERRVFYSPDLTYQEFGPTGSGNNPFQSGYIFFNADGQGCMIHLFPWNQRGQVNCSSGRSQPGRKVGDTWTREDGLGYKMVPGHDYYSE